MAHGWGPGTAVGGEARRDTGCLARARGGARRDRLPGTHPLVGRTIEAAGLRHLPGVYLLELERDGEILPAISPHQRLHARDRLVFVGVVDSVVDLQRFRGLVPACDQVFKLDVPRPERCLTEAVVSDTCPLVGRSIAASFGLGQALEVSGAAAFIAAHLVQIAGDDPWTTLAVVYLVTMLFTELITNNAAAVLMVYGPGGYRFTDCFRVGIPLNLLMAGITIGLAPLVWGF